VLRAGVDHTAVRSFAALQARQAAVTAGLLTQGWARRGVVRRVECLAEAYDVVCHWRHALAVEQGAPHLTGSVGADRFRTPITDDSPNLDRFGHSGRLADGAVWDEDSRTYTGGSPTPASEVAAAYGRAAHARFAAEAPGAQVLANTVVLPSGMRVTGNLLLRGTAAQELLTTGGQVRPGMETGGNAVYTATADTRARERLRGAAFARLATAEHGDTDAWWQAAYLLYQGPRYKRGSDAVHRVFLTAAAAVVLGEVPVLPHDLDLRCMVLGQTAATTTHHVCAVA
jgi:hypothetical protein